MIEILVPMESPRPNVYYNTLSDKTVDWMKKNIKNEWSLDFRGHDFVFMFTDKTDAILFKLYGGN